MYGKTLFLASAALLVALAVSAKAQAYGACYHAGYTHVGPGGVQHVGYTDAYRGGSGGAAYGRDVRYGGAAVGGAAVGGAAVGGAPVGGAAVGGAAVSGYSYGTYRGYDDVRAGYYRR